MIREQVLVTDNRKIVSQPNKDRGMLRTIESALQERTLAQRRSDARSHLLESIEATPDFVFAADEKGHLLYCNCAARKTLGIGAEKGVPGIHITDIYPAQARTHVLGEGIFTAVLDGVWSGETTLLTRTGREIPVSQVIIAPLATDRRSGFLSIIARDITKMKQAEAALQASEQFYRRMVEAANFGIWIINPENKITFANPKMAQLLGYKVDEILGKPTVTFMDEEGIALAEAHREAIRVGLEESHDIKLRRKNGTELWVNLSTSPLFNEQEQYTGTLALATEITELKRRIGLAEQWDGVR